MCSTGTFDGALMHKRWDHILTNILNAAGVENVVCPIVPIDTQYFDQLNARTVEAYHTFKVGTVFLSPALFSHGDNTLRDTMACISGNMTTDSMWRSEAHHDLSLKVSEQITAEWKGMVRRLTSRLGLEVSRIMPACQSAIRNSFPFFNQFTYQWQKYDVCLPEMSKDPSGTLVERCKEGWKKRFSGEVLGHMPDRDSLIAYKNRLGEELKVINRMGFANYFLLVSETVAWAKSNGIEVGPGRGSAGGSLISYLLGITDVDPIRFGLFFERFINPDRLDLPDIDLDFMSSRRGEVLEHLVDRYGENRVACISNYTLLGSASSLRSVAKARGLKEYEYSCSKQIPKDGSQSLNLEEALHAEPQVESFAIKYPEIWKEAVKLQGTYRTRGQHAAGVVVAGEDIIKRAVLETRTGEGVVNWDKRLVEDFGLIKLDILGLTTLDILALSKQYLAEKGERVDFLKIPLNDEKVLKAFGQGKTVGVFQFESHGMRNLLKSLATETPLTFEDITAATALYRPGPKESGLMDSYVAIRQGNAEPSYPHKSMIPALKETHSVMVYQEQVMQVARDLAGFTMAESDHLRKAMGKKDVEKMTEMRDKFVEGAALKSGMDNGYAGRLFDQIEQFAGYGFNKSHAVEYAVISYWTMWLKVYHPEIFYASALSVLDDIKLAKDANEHGIGIVPPDINKSSDRFELGYDKARDQVVIYAPFQMIKGLSVNASNAILKAKREFGRPFASKQEFIDNVERRLCNIRGQESLDKVGAFAEIEPDQIPARHPDRLRDQKQLMPTITTESVIADRKIEVSPYIKAELDKLVGETLECGKCTLAGACHPTPRLGRSPKIMIVTDCPNWTEDRAGRMGEGDASEYLKVAMDNAGLTFKDVYLTSLVKSAKPKKTELANEMILGCEGFLKREIELLKPPVILMLGGKVARHLCPELKGGWEELSGMERYDANLDSTFLVGMNPMMIAFDGAKQSVLNKILERASSLIS